MVNPDTKVYYLVVGGLFTSWLKQLKFNNSYTRVSGQMGIQDIHRLNQRWTYHFFGSLALQNLRMRAVLCEAYV